MLRLSLIVFLLSPFLAHTQTNWLQKRTTPNQAGLLDLDHFPNGDLLAGGYFGGTLNTFNGTLTTAGQSDAYLERLTSAGTSLWRMNMGGTQSDRITAVAAGSNGNALAIGYYAGTAQFGSYTLTATGDSLDIFIVSVSATGQVQWAITCGGPGNDYPHGIDVNSSGQVVVCGNFRETAQFGQFSYTAPDLPGSSDSSFDGFVAVLSADGTWQWVKQLTSSYDVNVLDVTIDNSGAVYGCGKFSQQLTIDDTYTNTADESGMVFSLTAGGDEIWFNTLSGGLVQCYDAEVGTDNALYITGNSFGTLAVITAMGSTLLPSSYLQQAFLLRFNTSGSFQWGHLLGSENGITGRKTTIGPSGECYMTGMFACVLTSMEDALGEGYFHSAGYHDVFVSRIENDGAHTWSRQYGGPGDDLSWGIGCTIADKPAIAGSFRKFFNVPESFEFQWTTQNEVVQNDIFLFDDFEPPTAVEYCISGDYGSMISIQGQGGQDMFISSPVSLLADYYDIYSRPEDPGECDRTPQFPVIADGPYERNWQEDSDDILICDNAGSVYFHTNTGTPGYIGPEYNWAWHTQALDPWHVVYQSQLVWLTGARADGCFSFADSVYVTLADPQCPSISLNGGPPSCEPYFEFCGNEEVTYSIVEANGYTTEWVIAETGEFISENEISVLADQTVYLYWTSPEGCIGYSDPYLVVIIPLDSLVPVFTLEYDSEYYSSGDTIYYCPSVDQIEFMYVDSALQYQWALQSYLTGHINGQEINTGHHYVTYQPPFTGWYTFFGEAFLHRDVCPDDTLYGPGVFEVYIVVSDLLPPPIGISEIELLCPGDSLLVTLTSTGAISWNGPEGNGEGNGDHWWGIGVHVVNAYVESEFCSASNSILVEVPSKPLPVITTDPDPPVVCPGGSVMLSVTPGIAYEWIGPLGNVISTEQTCEVSTPGYYFCRVTDEDGCTLESDFVETLEYTTPQLVVLPATDLCMTGSVTLSLLNNTFAEWQWSAPLFGFSDTQTVTEAGEYTITISSCGNTYSQSVEITNSPVIASIEFTALEMCPGDSIMLSANTNAPSWSWSTGAFNAAQVVISEPGNYSLTGINDFGCTAEDEVQVSYIFTTPPAGDDLLHACSGVAITAEVNSIYPVFWSFSPDGEPISGNGFSFDIENPVEDDFIYAFAIGSECPSLPLEIFIDLEPTADDIGIEAPDTACEGGNWWINAIMPSETGNWSLPNGETSPGNELSINPLQAADEGEYIFIYESPWCPPVEITYILEFNQPDQITPVLSVPGPWCEGDEITLSIPDIANAGDYFWSLPNGEISAGNAITIAVNTSNSGVYQGEVTGLSCNPLVSPVEVEASPLPSGFLDNAQVLCENMEPFLNGPDNMLSYLWSTGDTTQLIAIADTGMVQLQVINEFGCIGFDEIYLDYIDCESAYVNVFTPNGDARNDFVDFGMFGLNVGEVIVFNRWGAEVTRLDRPDLKWYGRTQFGDDAPSGTYYYIIVRKAGDIPGETDSGYITLLR
jgi:gliding motility-associated-like protein